MKKLRSIVLATKWFFLKNLYRKADIIFVWFVNVAFIEDQ